MLQRLASLYKIYKHISPYLQTFIHANFKVSLIRTTKEIPLFRVKQELFKRPFLPSTIIKWNNLDHSLCNVLCISTFTQNILKFICLGPNKVYKYCLLLTRLHIGLSHLCPHKLNHNFRDTLKEFFICRTSIETYL